jgi:hypothetical protein
MFPLGSLRVVQTGLSPEQAIAGLRRVTMPGGLFALDRPKPGSAPLRGSIDGLRFSVVRRTQFRNSFTPVVEGAVVKAEIGSQVHLQLGMHLVPMVVLVAWLLALLAIGVLAAQSKALSDMALSLVAVSLMGPGIGLLCWRSEVSAVVEEIVLAVTGPTA